MIPFEFEEEISVQNMNKLEALQCRKWAWAGVASSHQVAHIPQSFAENILSLVDIVPHYNINALLMNNCKSIQRGTVYTWPVRHIANATQA